MFIVKRFNKTFNGMLLIAILSIFGIYFAFRHASIPVKRNFLVGLSLFNIIYYFIYKMFLSKDQEFLKISGYETFNWWSELPLQLCNINMILVPIGILLDSNFILGFSFFVGPLGAMLAICMPEPAFTGHSLLKPRIAGVYGNHFMVVIAGSSLSTLGLFVPETKYIPGVVKVGIALVFVIHIINTILRKGLCEYANYFFTDSPGGVGILEKLKKIFKIPCLYMWPFFLVLIPYMIGVCKIYELFHK